MKTEDNFTRTPTHQQQLALVETIYYVSKLQSAGVPLLPQAVQELYSMVQLFTELDSINQKVFLSVLGGLHGKKLSTQPVKPDVVDRSLLDGMINQD